MVDHVSRSIFSVFTSRAARDDVIKAMVASVAKWSTTDIILKSDANIQGCCRSHDSFGVVERMIHEVGSLGQPSDLRVGGPTCGLVTLAVPSEEPWRHSALHACMDGRTRAKSGSSAKLCYANSVGRLTTATSQHTD